MSHNYGGHRGGARERNWSESNRPGNNNYNRGGNNSNNPFNQGQPHYQRGNNTHFDKGDQYRGGGGQGGYRGGHNNNSNYRGGYGRGGYQTMGGNTSNNREQMGGHGYPNQYQRGDYKNSGNFHPGNQSQGGQKNFQDPHRGGYQHGGYQQHHRGDYQQPHRGGYQQPHRGGYHEPRHGGYQETHRGGYTDRGGFNNNRGGGQHQGGQGGYQHYQQRTNNENNRGGYQRHHNSQTGDSNYGRASQQRSFSATGPRAFDNRANDNMPNENSNLNFGFGMHNPETFPLNTNGFSGMANPFSGGGLSYFTPGSMKEEAEASSFRFGSGNERGEVFNNPNFQLGDASLRNPLNFSYPFQRNDSGMQFEHSSLTPVSSFFANTSPISIPNNFNSSKPLHIQLKEAAENLSVPLPEVQITNDEIDIIIQNLGV